MPTPSTVREVLEGGRDDAEAIAAPGRAPLTYGGLRAHVDRTVADADAHITSTPAGTGSPSD